MITQTDLELLNAYLDNALLPDERRTLDSRLTADPALRADLESLRATRDLIRALPTPPLPRAFTLTREQATRESGVTLVRRVIPYIAAAAAAVTLAFGVLSLGGGDEVMQSPGPVANVPTRGAMSGALAPDATGGETDLFSTDPLLLTATSAVPVSTPVPFPTPTKSLTLTGGFPGEIAGTVAQGSAGDDTAPTDAPQAEPELSGTATVAPQMENGLTDAIMIAPMSAFPDQDSAAAVEEQAAETADTGATADMQRGFTPTQALTLEIAPAAAFVVPLTASPTPAPTAVPTLRTRDDVLSVLLEAIRALLVGLFGRDGSSG
jgi:hypothetical protein